MVFDERLTIDEDNRSNVIYDEHLVRYELAARLAAGKKVLDIACGTGYGSNILAQAGAEKVIGMDRSAEAVAEAKKNYQKINLEYKEGDAENIKEADKSFDLAVSFETIEHLQDADKYLAEIARVLSAEGLFLVSTPNREVFGQKNPFHLKEFTRGEFEAILGKYFNNIIILEQTNGIASIIKGAANGKIFLSDSAKPLYFLAICSNNALNLAEFSQESIVSVNPAALDRMHNNPAVKLVDTIYSLIIRIPGAKSFLKLLSS